MAALDGTLTLEQRNNLAMLIGQNLKLNVPRLLDELLHVELTVAEGVCSLSGGGVVKVGQLFRRANNAHAAPSPAGLGLEDNGVAHIFGPLERFRFRIDDAVGSGQNGNLGPLHGLASFFLLPHQPRYLRRRSNEFDV